VIHITEQPEYASAIAELNKYGAALSKVQSRIKEIEALLADTPSHGDHTSHVAAALEFAETGKVTAPTAAHMALRDEHAALRPQAESLQAAIKKRSSDLYFLAQRLSHEACRDQATEHRAIVGRGLAKLLELNKIFEEERAFFDSIERQGYSAGFAEYFQWPLLGTLSQGNDSVISQRVRELKRYVGA
jgi:hypothetical protein